MTDLAARRGADPDYYEPAEDSVLLADACAGRVDPSDVVIDVGTGSGIVGDRIRSDSKATVYGIDLNPHACRRAAARGLAVVRGDLLTPIRADVADVVVCNPPYLPTPPDKERSDWRAVAVAGGPDGREITDALLADLGRVLRPDGACYLVTSSLMDVDEVSATARAYGFTMQELARDESFPFEVLAVQRLRYEAD